MDKVNINKQGQFILEILKMGKNKDMVYSLGVMVNKNMKVIGKIISINQ